MSEDAKILAALVAALLGLLGVFYSTLVNYFRGREQDRFKAETDAKLASLKANTDKELARLNAELQTERDKRLDQLAAEKVVSKFRDPLLHSAYDLQSRIFNILKLGFLERYYTNGSKREQEYAVENTVFLLSQFLGWTELIRQEIQFLGLGTDTETRELRRLQDGLYTQLQSDKRDLGSGFRLFAGEQRAVGELMIERTPDLSRCIGFATFLKQRKPDIDYWLNPLREDIKKMATGIDSYKARLVNIQHSLIDLLHFLDPDCVRFPMERRTKI